MEEQDSKVKDIMEKLDNIIRCCQAPLSDVVDYKDFTCSCVHLDTPYMSLYDKRVLALKMGRLQIIHDMISNLMDFFTVNYFQQKMR